MMRLSCFSGLLGLCLVIMCKSAEVSSWINLKEMAEPEKENPTEGEGEGEEKSRAGIYEGDYRRYRGQGCFLLRYAKSRIESRSYGSNRDVYTYGSFSDCKRRCSDQQDCIAFSYSDYSNRDNCLLAKDDSWSGRLEDRLKPDPDFSVFVYTNSRECEGTDRRYRDGGRYYDVRRDDHRYDARYPYGGQYFIERDRGRYYDEDRYYNDRYNDDRYNDDRYYDDRYTGDRYNDDRYNDDRYNGDRYDGDRDSWWNYGDRYDSNNGWYNPQDCFKFLEAGRMLDFQNSRRSIPTRSMRECMQECIHDRDCWTIAFSTRDSRNYREYQDEGNCRLGSRLRSDQLRQLENRARWDLYERVDARGCRDDYRPRPPPPGPDYGDCFRKFRVGAVIIDPDDHIDTQDERQCENICRRTSRCEAYSYRMYNYGGSSRDYRNCLLSHNRYITTRNLRNNGDFDTYIKTYGRECDGRPTTPDTTVSGQRCYSGCRESREGRYYYCNLDRSFTWDFCCAPNERCEHVARNYGDRYPQLWCNVGEVTRDFKPRRPCNPRYDQYNDDYYTDDEYYYRTPTDNHYYYNRRYPLHSLNDTIVEDESD